MSSQRATQPTTHDLLAGKSVVITAAAGTGIGFATARRCIEEGARVMISDSHERRLGEAIERLKPLSAFPVLGQPCDVTKEDQVQALLGAAIEAFGSVDVVVNNAGLGGYAPLLEMDDEQWQRVLDVTLTGTMRMTRAAFKHMQAHYAAAKAGVMALTRCSAMEAAAAGVRVNAVAPSLAMHAHLAKVTPDGLLQRLQEREAFGRAAEPVEIANVIVFLASDLASYMTGEVLAVSSQHA
jgi:3-oxoacyl-[acyl-carrier protein] reductase